MIDTMRARDERRDFKSLLAADPDIAATLTPVEIERAFDLAEQFRHIDHIFDRVFSSGSRPDGSGGAEPVETLGAPQARH